MALPIEMDKAEKEYLCIRDGEEKGFTGAEFKQAQKEGWEKQYQYKVGRKKEYMSTSAAEAAGYERASKTPKSTRFGRQNPIAARWNSDEQLVLWRSAWADVTNRYLERVGAEARIDHRSHTERGILERPTIHEGVTARAMEQQGFIADRCELNRQIKADNKLLRELRSAFGKIAKAVKNTVPALAEVYTHDTNLKKRLRKYAAKYLELCKQTDDDDQGGLRFEIDKNRISIRLTAPYSDDRRKAASELAKKRGIHTK